MAFTQATIVHTFSNPDNSPASGEIDFALTRRMTNSGQTLVPGKVTATLDNNGHIAQVLTSNNDTGTIPGDSTWLVTLRIIGDSVSEYSITVPTGGGTVDLGTLLPQQAYGSA